MHKVSKKIGSKDKESGSTGTSLVKRTTNYPFWARTEIGKAKWDQFIRTERKKQRKEDEKELNQCQFCKGSLSTANKILLGEARVNGMKLSETEETILRRASKIDMLESIVDDHEQTLIRLITTEPRNEGRIGMINSGIGNMSVELRKLIAEQSEQVSEYCMPSCLELHELVKCKKMY